MEFQIFNISSQVREVADEKRYWFIRTYGGEAFSHYIEGNYVGLRLNKIPYRYIKEADLGNNPAFNILHNALKNNYEFKPAIATKWANQLISFEHEIRIGDTVLIPSQNSEEIAIGTITSNTALRSNPPNFTFKGKVEPLPEKIRNVEWLKIFDRDEFQGDLKNLISSHQGVTNADFFYEAIEGILSSLFIRNNKIHLVIQIKKNEEINAFDLSRFLNGITYFYKELYEEYGELANEDLTIKIKVQSKGKTLLAGFGIGAIMGIAGIIAMSNNPELKIELSVGEVKAKLESKAEGGFKSLGDFLDRNQKRKEELIIFQDSIKKLDAQRKDSLDNKGTNYRKKVRKKKKG